MFELKQAIADVPDFPRPGILFRDISPLLRDHFDTAIRALDALLTKAEKAIWEGARALREFTFTNLQKHTNTKNKKAVASAIEKAKRQGLLRHEGKNYVVVPE